MAAAIKAPVTMIVIKITVSGAEVVLTGLAGAFVAAAAD